MIPQTAEQLGTNLANFIGNPDGNKLTEVFDVVNADGKETGQTKRRFVLNQDAYIAIRAYLAGGLAFPGTAEEFHTLHPKENLNQLVELDAGFYDKTQMAMVNVHKSCDDFNKNILPSFRTVTSDTKQYAETAIKELAGFGENSFQGLLVILTNDKYEKAGSEDTPEFRGARESASRILLNLGLNSSKKAEDIQGLVDKLNSFMTTFKRDQDEVDEITKKFSGDGGFTSVLSKSLAKLREDLQKAVDEGFREKALMEENKKISEQAASYIWIPFAGWIAGTTVMIVHNNRASDAYNEYTKQMGIQEAKKKEITYMERLVADVTLLQSQNDKMQILMVKAKAGLEGVQKSYEQIGRDLKEASSLLGTTDDLLRLTLWTRQRLLKKRVDEVVADWGHVVSACDDFLNAECTYSGIVEGVVVPKSA